MSEAGIRRAVVKSPQGSMKKAMADATIAIAANAINECQTDTVSFSAKELVGTMHRLLYQNRPPPPREPDACVPPHAAALASLKTVLTSPHCLCCHRTIAAPQDIATQIKSELEARYHGNWHCFVGRNFGCFVDYQKDHFIYFYIGQVGVCVFKTV